MACLGRQVANVKLLTHSLNNNSIVSVTTMSQPNPPSSAPDCPPDAVASRQEGSDRGRLLRSEDLLQGQVEVLIAHGADIYRLRLTRSGKLILQK